MDITDLADDEQPPKPRKKTAIEKLHEDMQRQLAPFRQIQEMHDLVRQHSLEHQTRELLKQFVPERNLREMLDGTCIAAQVQRMQERYFPKNQRAQYADVLRRSRLELVSEAANAYEKYLDPVIVQQEWIEKMRRQAFGGLSVQDLTRQFEHANLAFAAMEAAKKSLVFNCIS